MAVARIWQAGAELQHINEVDADASSTYGVSSIAVSNMKAKTGAYSFVFSGSTNKPHGKAFSSVSQIRMGFFINHNGLAGATSSYKGIIAYVLSTVDIIVQWSGDGDLELLVNGTLRDSAVASTGGFSTVNTWRHIGVTCKADASAGFASVYIDGVQALTWTGNTGTGITGAYFGGKNSILAPWASSAYADDFYVDSAVGEADAAPPSPRFSFLLPNGAGNYTNWTANTGSNYAAVDDSGAPDDETTYVYATSSGVQDSYALTNTTAGVTVPAGYSIDAVIPIAWAKKTDAGTASTLKIGTRLSSTDNIGSAQTLATSYGPVWERQTTDPGSGAWSEADIDALEIVIESAGTF